LKIIDYVPDIAEILKKATIYIAPIFSGSGIKSKVLEAMATGLPVVGTKEAFEAIKIDNNEHGIIAENREDFLNALIELLPDSTRKEKIGKNAYALIKQKFSWDTIISKYLKLYNAICG
ncbi:MAG: glycosyltransferase family 4 protein, partial [Candidatus Micrarchaeia archaeon]